MDAVPSPGTVIGSRFRVESELGRGGMGVVLRGRDEANRPVAIKVLLPEAVEHPEAVPRFVNEARAARELTSEHAVRVIDAGTLDSGLPFMVMELLEGEDLSSKLEKGGPFSISDACDAVIDACDALAEAHARGMVHRDLKPANLFAAKGADGRVRVKVLDFGVSKVAAQLRQMALTSTGTALGTPYYMAPEQLKSAKGVDARADVWSLGVVLYELLTGTLPFDGKSFGMLFMQIVSEDPKPIHTLRPEIPVALSETVQTCMKKDRDHRFPDLAALVQALARFASPSGQAQAQKIAQERGAPQAARESNPMPAMALKGTMLMANAPNVVQAARDAHAQVQAAKAAAARQSSPEFASGAPVWQEEAPSGMGQRPSVPNPPLAPMQGDSGRWSMHTTPIGSYPTPNGPHAPAPPGAMAHPAAAAPKKISTGMIIAFIAACAVLLAVGVFFIVSFSARGH
jgi:eukaryotic-like serine/threonine-protein kinase